MLQALQLVVGGFEGFVGNQQDIQALLDFDLGDLGALFVQQERRDFDRHLGVNRGRVFFHRLFLDDAQDLQSRAFGVAHMARTAAAWAWDRSTFGQRRAQALAAHFHQAEFADGAKLHAGTVLAQSVAQAVFDFAAVAALVHVDEVDDDESTQIAQAHLARDFVGGFEVGTGRGFFDVAAFDRAG